jgi:chemotaxis protein MotB
MARRQKKAAHENHERWLVSYADFITMLFALFVVMFASSQADKGKAKQVSESVEKAFTEGKVTAALAQILGGTADDRGKGNAMMRGPGGVHQPKQQSKEPNGQLAELLPSLEVLNTELKREIEAGLIRVHMEKRGLVVSFTQAALFPSGEDSIAPESHASLRKVADAMQRIPNPVRLEGHTDAIPIKTARFHSNWDLSAARSIAILEYLTESCQIARQRLSVAGYAETAPVDDNSTEAGRARNRRVDIVILNEAGIVGQPGR